MDGLSPEIQQLLRLCLALGFVLLMMGGLSIVLKKLGLAAVQHGGRKTDAKRRLKVIETLPLDARRRFAILRCDNKDYVVILGPESETLLDQFTSPVDSSQKEETPPSA